MSAEKKETTFSIKSLQTLLIEKLASKTDTKVNEIDPKERFNRYGLKSAKGTEMAAELSNELGIFLAVTTVWDYPTIEKLSQYLANELKGTNTQETKTNTTQNVVSGNSVLNEPIAVIGIACRFPQAASPSEYWELLKNEIDAIQKVPSSRWSLDDFYSEDTTKPGMMSTQWGGFLDQVDKFDASFFGISPKEAKNMDPQQRIMMELSWEAIEDARLLKDSLQGTDTGVFFGNIWSEYSNMVNNSTTDYIEQHSATGYHYSIIANRVSYFYGLMGASLVCDTACSSSLVAIHLACQSLRSGETSLAFAGGVNLILTPNSTVAMSKFGGMAPDGRSKAFDSRANGYVRGEGAGVILLKPLSKAIADGNQIYGVIKGSAVNNDGPSNGLTAPNPKAQEFVLRDAYKRAGIETTKVNYVECHGTGTALGDPLEVGALGAILGKGRNPETPLLIGSVKTNIGHLEAAAGIAGFIKVLLAIKNKKIPRSLNYIKPNPNIPFEKINIKVQSESNARWPVAEDELFTAGVSSFGFGGTNAHVVLQEIPESTAEIFVLSADSQQNLKSLAKTIKDSIKEDNSISLEEICSYVANNFSSGKERIAITTTSKEQLVEQLSNYLSNKNFLGLSTGSASAKNSKIVFVFPGQGSQWVNMGIKLMRTQPVFRAKLEECDRAIKDLAGWSLIEELAKDKAVTRINDLGIIQPAIFSIEVALAALWESWGIKPDVVIGHSMGEVGSAYVAGILRLEDAVKVICHRSVLAKKTAGKGGMCVIDLPMNATQTMIAGYEDRVSIASSNSPVSTVISGEPSALQEISAKAESQGIFSKMINVDFASHSPQMDEIKVELYELLKDIYPMRNEIKIMSTVFSEYLEGRRFEASYWVRNIREAVLFSKATQLLLNDGYNIFLEMSPHPILEVPVQQTVKHFELEATVLPSFRRNEDEQTVLFDTLGKLYTQGVKINWEEIYFPTKIEIKNLEDNGQKEKSQVEKKEKSEHHIFLFSGKTKKALEANLISFKEFVNNTSYSLKALSASTTVDKNHFDFRLAFSASSKEDLFTKLEEQIQNLNSGKLEIKRVNAQEQINPVFFFGGQGQQWIGMGKDLLKKEKVFRKKLEEIDDLFSEHANWSIIKELEITEDHPDGGPKLDETEYAQPCIFAIQVALVEVWKSKGITPSAVVGHSVGEVASAHVAGVLNLRDAVKVIYYRSKYMQAATGKGGKMAAVKLNATVTIETIEQILDKYQESVGIGVYNSHDSIVLSGAEGILTEILAMLKEMSVPHKMLPVNYAFHSVQMEPFKKDLVNSLFGIKVNQATIPIISTVRGKKAEIEDYDAEYWGRNVVGAVRFFDAINFLISEQDYRVFIEVSAHPVLKDYVNGTLKLKDKNGLVLTSMVKEKDPSEGFLDSIGKLFMSGYSIRFNSLYREGVSIVKAPSYSWQRERFWPEFAIKATKRNQSSLTPMKQDRLTQEENQGHTNTENGHGKEIKKAENPKMEDATVLVADKQIKSQPIVGDVKKIQPVSEIKQPESPVQVVTSEYPVSENKEVKKDSTKIQKKESNISSDPNSFESVALKLSNFVAQTVGLETNANIDHDKLFSEMGIDSIMGIEFRVKLEKEFKVKLPETVIVDENTSTIEKLAKHILSLLK